MAKQRPSQAPPALEQELGSLEVAEGVFRDLFTEAIGRVPGVAALNRPAAGLFGRSGDAVTIERGGGEVAFSVALSVHYDVNIPDLAAELRQQVGSAIEEATGYKVRAVSVTIDHILPPRSPAAEQDEPTGNRIPEIPPVPDEE